MKGVKTKIVVAPFKAWFTFGEQIANEGGFTLSKRRRIYTVLGLVGCIYSFG